MKRALGLLGEDYWSKGEVTKMSGGFPIWELTEAQLEALVQRAREEMRELCAQETEDSGPHCSVDHAEDIRALPLTAQPDDGSGR